MHDDNNVKTYILVHYICLPSSDCPRNVSYRRLYLCKRVRSDCKPILSRHGVSVNRHQVYVSHFNAKSNFLNFILFKIMRIFVDAENTVDFLKNIFTISSKIELLQ